MRVPIAVSCAALIAVAPLACSSKQAKVQNAGVAYVPVGAPEAGAPGPGAPGPGPSAPVATGPDGGAGASAAEAALDVALLALADVEAPGMKPEGNPLRANVRETEHAEVTVTLLPGHCYTVIAMSPPAQITDLQLRLNMMPFNAEALHSGPKERNPVFIGRGKAPTCPVAPIPIQYKIEVSAKKGSGAVVAQLFSRAR